MDIEKEIATIKERNQRVEIDKTWETSWTRRIFIAAITYVVAICWLVIIKETIPFLKAVVPVAGYLLSTLSLPIMKRWWVRLN
ncbi:MAG: hypothetical protein Q8L10_03590 [Candidatus Moranbacteria bacterium]|nr:hypothetical protein [Candidatus Moranbacteria bacterium]